MKRKKLINRFLNVFGIELSRVNTGIFKNDYFDIPKPDISIKDGQVYFKKLSLTLPIKSARPLIEGYQYAIKIVENLKGKFLYKNNELIAEIEEIRFFINEADELFIINEVFVENCYNIILPETNIIAIDIGMNVGITSLYLSAKKNVQKIYSYELFPPTFEHAVKNISLNPTGKKIIPHSYGWGSQNETLNLEYSAEEKGRMGLLGLPADRKFKSTLLQSVEIKKASDELTRLIEQNNEKMIVCKMDCEGAEYDIIEDLASNNLLEKIAVYMIEWHFKDPRVICDMLEKKDFVVFCLTFQSNDSGLIYAVKKNIN